MTYHKEDPKSIQKMFGSIAQQYDRTNAILSLQMHRYWNKKLIELTLLPQICQSYLDLCCGTGEISFNYLQKCTSVCNAYLLDFCPEMLFHAKEREKTLSQKHHISYLQADAQQIPLTDESIDCITIAYGIRNIPKPQQCFKETFRVLKKNGKMGILELTQPQNWFLKVGHSLYLNAFIPLMGKLITSNRDAYQYLCNSIKSFSQPIELETMLKTSGFSKTHIIPLTGGIATIIIAEK